MATLPSLKVALINSLNKLNNQNVSPNDVTLASFTAEGSAVLKGGPNKPNYGEIAVAVNLIDLETFFTKVGKNIKAGATCETLTELLPTLSSQLGLTLPNGTLEEATISWTGTVGSVRVAAKAGNRYFKGATTITLEAVDVPVSTLFTRNYFTVATASEVTAATVLAAISSANAYAYNDNVLNFSAPMSLAEAGVSNATYNTVIRVTGKKGSIYSGSYDVFYNRVDLGKFEAQSYSVPDDFSGDLLTSLAFETFGLRADIQLGQLTSQELDLSTTPAKVTLKAKPASYVAFGQAQVSVLRFKDDTQSLTIDFTANNTAMVATTLSNLCKAKVPKAGRLNLTVNVANDVYLVGSSLTEYGLTIQAMAQYGEVDLTLNNRGFISGRGQKGSSGFAPTPAGPGLFVDPNFRGRVRVNNLGKITGGGGGGARSAALYYVGGGGGQPLGPVSDTGSTSPYYDGPAATLTAFGAARQVWRSENLYYWGGAGGALGQPGRQAKSQNGSPPYYTYNTAQQPSDAGVAVVDTGNLIEWQTLGTVLPTLQDPVKILEAWAAKQGAREVSDSMDLSQTLEKDRVLVRLSGDNSFYATDASGAMVNKMSVVGPVWKGPVARHKVSVMLGVVVQACQTADTPYWLYFHKYPVYLEFEAQAKGVDIGSNNRNLQTTSPLGNTTPQTHVVRAVYFDPYVGMLMDVNPYLGTAKPFTEGMADLSQASGELPAFT